MKDNENIYQIFDMLIELNNAVDNEVIYKVPGKKPGEKIKIYRYGKTIDEILESLSISLDEFVEKIIDVQRAFPENQKDVMGLYAFMIDADKVVDTMDPESLKEVLSRKKNPRKPVLVYAAYPYNNYVYLSLSGGEYTALKRFARDHQLEPLLDDDGLYKIRPDYNQYLQMNKGVISMIREKIDKGDTIDFVYGKDKKTKTILPVMLYEDTNFGYTYVISQGKKKFEFYRVDRMQFSEKKANGTAKKTANKKKQKPEEITQEKNNNLRKRLHSIWGLSGGETEVEFKVYNEGSVMQKVMRDLKPYIEHAGYQTKIDADGNLIVTGEVIGTSDFERFVRKYGASIVVLRPEDMRKRMIHSAKQRLVDLGETDEGRK